jgi:hypothetical protein
METMVFHCFFFFFNPLWRYQQGTREAAMCCNALDNTSSPSLSSLTPVRSRPEEEEEDNSNRPLRWFFAHSAGIVFPSFAL